MRLLQSWFTIERCSIVEAGMARGCSPWGVASSTHIVCGLHARRRVSLSSVQGCVWHRSDRGPRSSHRNLQRGSEASNNAISGYLGAGLAFGKGLYQPGWRSARSAPSGATTIGELCLARVPISARPSTAMRAMARHFSAIGSALEP